MANTIYCATTSKGIQSFYITANGEKIRHDGWNAATRGTSICKSGLFRLDNHKIYLIICKKQFKL